MQVDTLAFKNLRMARLQLKVEYAAWSATAKTAIAEEVE